MRGVVAFSAAYLLAGSVWFLRTANSEFVIYVLVIVVLLAGVLRAQRTVRWPTWMLWAFSAWGLMHVLGGAVEIGDHVLFAQRLVPVIDRGGDFYVLKYDQVVHGYLYGLVAVMTHHVLRHVFRIRGHDAAVAISAVLVALGISSLNELMEFLISLTMANGVGGYDNTMLDFVFNFSGAVLATTAYVLLTRRRGGPTYRGGVSDFAGFPVSALDFYDDLEVDNTKSFWEAHKATYDESVKAPMLALTAALEPEFGRAKVFRPYRDVRFAKDKTPYKTHQGAFVAAGESTGWYVEISARGTRVSAGYYEASGPRLAAMREAIAHDRFGSQLETVVADLEAEGFEISGEKLKTSPRGYDADHPRIELLRHKQLMAGRRYGFEADDIGPGLLERVRDDWRALRPLVEWCAEHSRT